MDNSRRTVALLALNSLAVAAVARHALASPARTSRAARMARYFPNVELRTQHDRRVRFYDDLVKGKKVLINFMYTECSRTCPRTTANLVKVQNALGDRVGRDVFLLSLTLTPDRDTPERLKAYAAEQGCRPGWSFLTGRMEDIDRVRRSLGVYDNPDITQHVGILTFGNEPEGKWGATPALGPADQIVWSVTSRIDRWVARPWPSLPSERRETKS